MRYEVRKNNDEVIISSNRGVGIRKDYSRNFQHGGVEYLICLEVETKGEKESGAVRRRFFDILERASKDFIEEQRTRFNKYNHIIQTISTQILQKMSGFWDGAKWHSPDYLESLEKIEDIFTPKKSETSKLIHYFNKMSIDLRSHIEGWDIIYIKDSYNPDYKEFRLKRAILNQYSSFAEDFNDSGIQIKFSEDFLEDYTVSLDKTLFSLIMYNFFSNALKYSKSKDVININYSNNLKILDIFMYSIKIEQSEIPTISTDGVRGKHANSISSSGNGSGLYVIKKSLGLMGLPNMKINPGEKSKFFDNTQYFKNHFSFVLKKEDN